MWYKGTYTFKQHTGINIISLNNTNDRLNFNQQRNMHGGNCIWHSEEKRKSKANQIHPNGAPYQCPPKRKKEKKEKEKEKEKNEKSSRF